MPDPVAVVLDTNVVLDWLVFRNPHCAALGHALEERRVAWLATDAMRGELAHVLGRGVVSAWSLDEPALWRCWDRLVQPAEPPPAGMPGALRCTDPDDQKFIDLALGRAQWLVTRDRAVLKLARRAALRGLRVVTPAQWAAP